MGASWATVVSYSVSSVFFLLLVPAIRPMALLGIKIAAYPFLLALAISGGLHYLSVAFWWKFLIAGGAYLAGAMALGSLTGQDVRRVSQMFQRAERRA